MEKPAWQDDFLLGYHDKVCRPTCPNREQCSQRWASFLPAAAVYAAAAHLEERPRDVQVARLMLHDAQCMSSCTGEQRVDHSRRQATAVACLRKAVKAHAVVAT